MSAYSNLDYTLTALISSVQHFMKLHMLQSATYKVKTLNESRIDFIPT